MDLNNTICANNGNHKKKQLILEARHSKVIEDANNQRSKLQPRIFMPKQVNKLNDNLSKNSKTRTAALTLRAGNNNVVKYLSEIPKLTATQPNWDLNLKNIAQRVKRKIERDKMKELKRVKTNLKSMRSFTSSRYKTKLREINKNKRTIQNGDGEVQKIKKNNNGAEISNSQGNGNEIWIENIMFTMINDKNKQKPEQDEDIEERLKEMGLEITDNNEISETSETLDSHNSPHSLDIRGNTLRPTKTLNDSLEISKDLDIEKELRDNDEIFENLDDFDSPIHPTNSRNSTELAKDMPNLTSNDSLEISKDLDIEKELRDNDDIFENLDASNRQNFTELPKDMPNLTSNDSLKISENLDIDKELRDNDEIFENLDAFDSPTHPTNSRNSTELPKDMPVLNSNDSMDISRELEMDLELTDNDEISRNLETLESTTHPTNFRNSRDMPAEPTNDSIKITEKFNMSLEILSNTEISATFESTSLSTNSPNSIESTKDIEGNHEISLDLTKTQDQTTIPKPQDQQPKTLNKASNVLQTSNQTLETFHQDYYEIVDYNIHKNYKKYTRTTFERFWKCIENTMTTLNEYVPPSSSPDVDTLIYDNVYSVEKSMNDFSNFILQNEKNIEKTMKLNESIASFFIQSSEEKKTLFPDQFPTNNETSKNLLKQLLAQRTAAEIEDQIMETSQSLHSANLHLVTTSEMEKEFNECEPANGNYNCITVASGMPRNDLPLTAARSQNAIPAIADRSLTTEQRSHLKHRNIEECARKNNNQKLRRKNPLQQIPAKNITNPSNNFILAQCSTSSLQNSRHSKLPSKSTRFKFKAHIQSRHNTAHTTSTQSIIQKSKFSTPITPTPNESYQPPPPQATTQLNMSCPRPFQPKKPSSTSSIIQKSILSTPITPILNESYQPQPPPQATTQQNMSCPRPFQPNKLSNIYHLENPIRIHTYSTNFKEVQPRYIEVDIHASTQVNFNYTQQQRNPAIIEQMPSPLNGYFRRPWIPFGNVSMCPPPATYQPMTFGSTIESMASLTNPGHSLQPSPINGMWSKTSLEWPSSPSAQYFNNTSLPLTPPADVNYQNLSFPINEPLPTTNNFETPHSFN